MTDTPSPRSGAAAIVIPCYNAAPWIARTIRSARAQRPAAVIVVDDGSTDGSLAAAREEAAREDPTPVRVLAGPNGGACRARNRGLAEVTVPFVKFLDADDELEGDLLAGELAAAADDVDLVLSPMTRVVDGAARETIRPAAEADARTLYATWLTGAGVNPTAQLWRASTLRRIGGWNEAVLLNQDGELALRALLRGVRVAVNRRGRALYHASAAGSLSKSKSDAKIASHADFLGALLDEARGTPFEAEGEALRRVLYGLARMAFRMGCVEGGRRALAVMRRHGGLRHYGGRAHRAAATLLGLERKVRLWGS